MFIAVRDLMSKWKWLDQKLEQNSSLDDFVTGAAIQRSVLLIADFLVVVLPCFFFGPGWIGFLFFSMFLLLASMAAGDTINRKRRNRRFRRY